MSRLAREGQREMVLYRIAADASPDAFVKHEHIGGEFYLVLKGKIADETGEYEKGDIVFLDRSIGAYAAGVGRDGCFSAVAGGVCASSIE